MPYKIAAKSATHILFAAPIYIYCADCNSDTSFDSDSVLTLTSLSQVQLEHRSAVTLMPLNQTQL
jgi:hypothetical protein